MTTARVGRGRFAAIMALAAVVLAIGPSMLKGAVTNQIPFWDSFESYTNNTYLGPNQGWYGVTDEENLRVVTAVNDYSGQWPLNETKTNYLSLMDSVTNPVIDDKLGAEDHEVHVDMLMKPRRWVEEEQPVVTNGANDVQMAFYLNSNGYVTVWCASFSNAPPYSLLDPQWVTLEHNPISSNTWIRLTLALVYNYLDGNVFYKIRVNNSFNLTNYVAQTNKTAYGTHGGEWFAAAYQGNLGARQIEFNGQTYLDSFLVTNGEPSILTVYTVHSTHDAGVNVTPSAEYVTVLQGNDQEFAFAAHEGYTVTNVAWGDGTGSANLTNSLGPVASFTFTNVLSDHCIHAYTEIQKRTLVVNSEFGTPDPAAGTTTHDYNTLINASVAGSPIDVSAGSRTTCVGWVRHTLLSGVTNTGSGTNMSFNIKGATTDDYTVVDWVWKAQNFLTVTSAQPTQGSVSVTGGTGWRNADESPTATATALLWDWQFTGWSGDTNGTAITGNQITLPMTQPRNITASFAAQTYGPHGVPVALLQQWGLTNPPYATVADAENSDPDFDTLKTWQEFIAGTHPLDAQSVFEALAIGHGSPSNRVVFYGTTNWGVALPFAMYRGTNLMMVNPWTLITTDIPRDPTGTNVWWDTNPPLVPTPVLYRPVATNLPTP